MKTLLTVGDAPRREPPNDRKKPPVKHLQGNVNHLEGTSGAFRIRHRAENHPWEILRVLVRESLLHFHSTIRTAKKFTGTKSLGTFVAVRISHDKKQTGRKENGKVSL